MFSSAEEIPRHEREHPMYTSEIETHATEIKIGAKASFIPSIYGGVARTSYHTVTNVTTWTTTNGTVIYVLYHVGGSMTNLSGMYLVRE
jgi:hypothetical protein